MLNYIDHMPLIHFLTIMFLLLVLISYLEIIVIKRHNYECCGKKELFQAQFRKNLFIVITAVCAAISLFVIFK